MTEKREEQLIILEANVIPVTADDTMSEAARKSMLKDLIDMLKHEEGSRTGEDIEDVHDMRVATRRMRSVMRLLSDYFKPKTFDRFRKRLSRVANALGEVRDLDVMIDNLERFKLTLVDEAQHELQGAIGVLSEQRETARAHLNAALDKGDYKRFVDDFTAFVTKPGADARGLPNGADPKTTPTQTRHVLPVQVYLHLASVRAYDRVLEDADDQTLHALRIEIKRLRYLVTVFSDILATPGKDFVGELKALQDHLGTLNDDVVAQQKLTDLKVKLSEPQGAALQIYINTLSAEANSLRAKFPDVWRHFNTKIVQRQLATAVAGL